MPPAREFQQRQGAPIFCYLQRGHPALRQLLSVLSGAEGRSQIYVQGIDPHQLARHCSSKVCIHTSPADLAKVLPSASLLMHHGGLGTAYAGLAAGVPQVVLPVNLEHAITAKGLAEFNVAITLPTNPPPESPQLTNILRAAVGDSSRQLAALSAAKQLEQRRDDNSLTQIASVCARYL
jgi:hypothetical protein